MATKMQMPQIPPAGQAGTRSGTPSKSGWWESLLNVFQMLSFSVVENTGIKQTANLLMFKAEQGHSHYKTHQNRWSG